MTSPRAGLAPSFARRGSRSGAFVDTAPAVALLGVVLAIACPYLLREGHALLAWVVGSVLVTCMMALISHPWWSAWLDARRLRRHVAGPTRDLP